ncbi:hypothetical protein EJ03DRAFT_375431 [Teratosphaeria nubilosa]|uniref:Uncharacterized protein n=1 Tax=Teratosphaeria nubilosa TaxID=161662 RepID=A0A6G1L7J4_9PEZI|nr:hypothetical protein EJ03DRAFT_375431 [Teratosphaeria nubilosa]
MGGSDQPYMYDPPARRGIAYPYSNFNPKAVTHASYARLSQLSTNTSHTTKKQGPLINFNQHPDSYVVVAGNQTEHKPLPPHTKKAVVSVRWVTFGFRILQEIGAIGLLVCVICIRGTSGGETYLLRIPQAWDMLITLYAIYHLARSAKSRPAGSAASYHVFALIMDVALLPLYIYITLAVNSNRQLPVPQYKSDGDEVDGDWRFTSFFSAQAGTNLLLEVTTFAAAVMAGLHLLTTGLDLYLAIIFRKIACLPPDMNPLEDNLTSRHGSKHKYKDSDASVINEQLSDAEKKRLAHMSGSTLNGSRVSMPKHDSTIIEDIPQIPFGYSRNGSKTSLAFSPHNPDSARWSRHQYDGQQDLYRDAATNPNSRYIVRPDGKLDIRPRGERGSSPNKHMSATTTTSNPYAQPATPTTPTKQPSTTVVMDATGAPEFERPRSAHDSLDRFDSPRPASYHTARTTSPHTTTLTADNVNREQKQQLLADNWYVLEDEASVDLGAPAGKHRYAPVATHDRHDSFDPTAVPKPLGMHPPTPEPDHDAGTPTNGVTRSDTIATNNTISSSVYSESAPSLSSHHVTTPKSRYYGDLAAATAGIRKPSRSPAPKTRRHVEEGRTGAPYADGQARVVSRSGADLADLADRGVVLGGEGWGVRARREVSGKVVEEGRGGRGW